VRRYVVSLCSLLSSVIPDFDFHVWFDFHGWLWQSLPDSSDEEGLSERQAARKRKRDDLKKV
jgi:hypothetical protein